MRKILILFVSLLLIYSCNNEVDITNPVVDPSNFMAQTKDLNSNSKVLMEGVYEVIQGRQLLGDQVVAKWNRDRLTVYSEKDGGYIVLDAGYLDSVIFFSGYWRYSVNTETGAASFYIPSDAGGGEIISGDTTIVSTSIKFIGEYGVGNELASNPLVLKYKRPLSQLAKNSDFYIMAHRGGGRTSDYLGVSENTTEMLNIAERIGGNAVEIDARLSKDGVAFLYHDADINLRLTQKGLIWGDIKNLTWAQISTLITLRNGEKIPTLRDALEFILNKTTIRAVWLDTKDINVMPIEIEMSKEFMQRAAAMGRDLNIYVGIPTDEIQQAAVSYPDYQNINFLCELTPADARQVDASAWGPRWTLGTQAAELQQMHAEGRKVIVWTVDEPLFIQEYINAGFDGMVTNYPTLVAYYLYIR
jgi:glycerophosphoryl diester phosphodiesterase